MKKILFLALLVPTICFSQRIDIPIEFVRNNLNDSGVPNVNYKGSPYLNKEFVEGKVTVNNDMTYNREIRYNAYSDIFEFKDENNEIKTLQKSNIVTVKIEGKFFEMYDYLSNNSAKEGYFEKLNRNGKTILLKQHHKKFIDAVKANSSYQEDTPAKFVLNTSYFVKKDELSPAIKIILKKKNILRVLKDKEVSIKEYISKKKPNFKNEQEVAQLFDYYNSL